MNSKILGIYFQKEVDEDVKGNPEKEEQTKHELAAALGEDLLQRGLMEYYAPEAFPPDPGKVYRAVKMLVVGSEYQLNATRREGE